MPLQENRTRRNYRQPKVSRAFLYKETHSRTQESEEPVTYYVISMPFNHAGNSKIESPIEENIMKVLVDKKSKGDKLIRRLPPGLSSVEERTYCYPEVFTATITREPYNPKFSPQTSTGYKGNK